MRVSLQHVNALPVRTWNRLKINDTVFEEQIPEIGAPGFFAAPSIPEGLEQLAALPEGFPEMETAAGQQAQRFVQGQANTGLVLRAGANAGTQQPAVAHYCLSAEHPALVDNNALLAEAGSSLALVQIYESAGNGPGFHAGLTRIEAGANSRVLLVQIQLLNDNTPHWNDVGVIAHEGAKVEIVHIELGAKRALGGCKALLQGYKSRVDMKTFYYGSGRRSLDFGYSAKHLGAETESEISAAGALFGQCEKTYRGSIEFVRGAARSVGHEAENTLLFSGECVNRSAPLILCGEENVEGMHAATIGRVDANLMFYLNSRGIPENQARHMLVQAQLSTVLSALPDKALARRVQAFLQERMAGI